MGASNKFFRAGLLLAALVATQFTFAQSQYRFQHFTTKDGAADDFAYSLGQDSLGYIWVQYYGGLSRFDGYNFKVYKFDKDDPGRSSLDFLVGRIFEDSNKNIWITQHGHPPKPPFTIARHDRKTDGFVKFTAPIEYNFINQLAVDKDGKTLWLSRGEGQGLQSWNMETNEIISYTNLSPDKEMYNQQNTVFDSEPKGSSMLLATQKGLWSLDITTKTFSRPACNPKDSSLLYHSPIYFIGANEKFWVAIHGSMIKLGPDLSVIQRVDFPPGFSGLSEVGPDGIIWFGTWTDGIYRYNPQDNSFVNIRNVPGDPHSLISNAIFDILVDKDNNVWVATAKGISKLLQQDIKFGNLDMETSGFTIYNAKGKDMLVTSQNDPKTGLKDILVAPIVSNQPSDLQFQKLLSVQGNDFPRFSKGRSYFWISTRVNGSGIYGLRIDPMSEMIEAGSPLHFRHDPNNTNTINSNDVGAMWEDHKGNLWVGDQGLTKINLQIEYGKEGSVRKYKYSALDDASIHIHKANQIYPEDEDSFWVLDSEGVDLFHRETEKIEHIFKNREIANFLHKTSDGNLFLGTVNGLYKAKEEGDRIRFESTRLWAKGEITAIEEDQLGRLWLYSRVGLVCYDPKENTAIEFDENDGILHSESIERGYLQKTSSGLMILSDPSGFSFFDPHTLRIDPKKVKPILTNLEVNNRPAKIGTSTTDASDFFTEKDISVLDELTIDYQHNNFAIEFSAMEMTAPQRNLYRHKLEGYDENWIETDFRNRTTTYTNLDPGTYTFKVKASNRHGIWSDFEKTLKIHVLPPPWKTTWAYIGYGLLVVGLLLIARGFIVQRERLKSNLKLAKVEQEKEHFELEKAKEVDKIKSTFFTNISHEFRTPLTLIKGPVQNLLEQFAEQPNINSQLKLVQRNSDLLLKLINQLLDLARLESGSLTVEKTNVDLKSFLSVAINSFSSLALQKSIDLTSEINNARHIVMVDKDKLETVLINLINNAIKFTPANGKVNLSASVEGQNVKRLSISVRDNGIGIPPEEQERIFERFHQVSESHKEVGTGIGLALVKELIVLMGGTITVASEPGKGSEFNVTLPIELVSASTVEEEIVFDRGAWKVNEGGKVAIENQPSDQTSTKPNILVVEDNTDLRKFIIESLGSDYHFSEAADGKQGLEIAFESTPDLIISDVMMPEMDGITMTGKIKNDTRTSHIPLILLTAKISDESKLVGLGTGADDYLTKPFNKNELLLKIRNSIALRVKLREKIKLELLSEGPKLEAQSADEQFLFKVRELILARLSDEQLSVESLAEDIALSRSQLLRKVTALTGMSVNELIRTFRLQKAAQLLEQNWGPITQVAYEVGFSNHSYFSKVFKDKYGVLPSEYNKKAI